MALAHSAVGAAGTHTTGTNAATFPYSSPAKGTVVLLLTETKPETLSVTRVQSLTITGRDFTEIGPVGGFTGGTGSAGADTGPVRVQAWLDIADGLESTGNVVATLSASVANSSVNGRVVQATRSAGATISANATGGSDNTAASSWSVTMAANPGITAADLLYTFGGAPTDTLPTFGASAISATGAVFTQAFVANPTSASGNDTGGRIESWTITGTATAVATHTIALTGTTTNWAGAEILVRLREVRPAPPPRIYPPYSVIRTSTR